MLPNFVICGAPKAGTTSLHEYLKQHPDVFLPEKKEIHFFNKRFDQGVPWYESHFAAAGTAAAVGETSPTYFTNERVPGRMAEIIPSARLMFILRNPVDLVHSLYRYQVSRGIDLEPFSALIRRPDNRLVRVGFYLQHIDRFLNFFGRESVHCLITEALSARPTETIAACFDFLGVDPAFRCNDSKRRHNVTRMPRNRVVGAVVSRVYRVRKRLRGRLPRPVRACLVPLQTRLTTESASVMDQSDAEYLTEVFAGHNERLSDFLGQDLSVVWI